MLLVEQDLRLAQLGYKVIGIDISDKLIEKAKKNEKQMAFMMLNFICSMQKMKNMEQINLVEGYKTGSFEKYFHFE